MRLLSISLAYASAALAASIMFILFGVIESSASVIDVFADLRFVAVVMLAAAVYATPVALPVIIATEIQRNGTWRTFIGAGAVLGMLLTIFFTGIPFEWANLRYSGIFLPISIMAALVYWLIAWKWMPQNRREVSDVGEVPA